MFRGSFKLFLLIVAGAVLLMAYQGSKGALRPFSFLGSTLDYVNESIQKLSASIRGVSIDPEDVEKLNVEIKKLKLENMKLTESAIEAGRLKELLSLKEREAGYFASARVIARGADPWAKTVVIDKGAEDLIVKGMAVMASNGLAGKVHEVGGSHSTVLLMDDKRFKASARLQASRTEGIFSGTGSRECVLEFVDAKSPASEGEIVVTSGLDGLFPPGLSIGYVLRVSGGDKQLFKEIEVKPFADTSRLEEVIILRGR